jgi:hypothetical protein
MVIENLNFFDKFGKNLNLDWDSSGEFWKGSMFFPELSNFLFDNENIFILEKISGEYKFPAILPGESIKFEWKDNSNEEELFIYDVEKDYDLNNFFIQKRDSYSIAYDDLVPTGSGVAIDVSLPLQLNIAFNPSAEDKFERILFIYIEDEFSPNQPKKVAELYFYGEGVDEDERFGVWARNFGIRFNKEDANILREYDIKEAFPDWSQLNTARKSLLVNKDQVYPYIGTYKGLSNFVNLLGYKDVLQIKEYWKNSNLRSPYKDKKFLVDITDYLDDGKIDEMNILDRNKNIKFGKQFKKTEMIALVYQFTKATDNFDDDGIPEVEATTEFTVDEIFYKLNHLGKKLKNEFLPVNVKIQDIIGEFVYFQKVTIKFWRDDTKVVDYDMNERAEVVSYPDSNVNFILRSLNPLFRKEFPNGADFQSVTLNDGITDPFRSGQKYTGSEIPGLITAIKQFYSEIKDQKYPDIGVRLSWEDGDDPERIIGAPAIFSIYNDKFTFESFRGVTFEDLDSQLITIDPYYTLNNIEFRNFYEITWKIVKDSPNPYNFSYRGKIEDLHELPHFLPYAGTYRVIAELHDFYGNTSVFSKFVTVESDQVPHIIAAVRLEDKFDYRVGNLSNVKLEDFGASPNYFPKVNVLDSQDAITEIDVYKNLMEWTWFYKNRYGMGQNLYDVELYDDNTGQFIAYTDPFQNHPKVDYWGLGSYRSPMKLSDFSNMRLGSMFFARPTDLVYLDDFNAGFYLHDPKPGDRIQISLYSEYIIPQFSNLEELVEILNSSDHPAIKLFNYEIIKGRQSDLQYIIHAQAEYLSKIMYHILAPGVGGSLASPSPSPGGNGNQAKGDKYTFFLPLEVYSQRLIDHFRSISPVFDVETMFLAAKTSDILTGAVQDPSFWVYERYWRFENDSQRGHLPTTIDQNAFAPGQAKVFEDSFYVPENAPVFFTVNNLDGKLEYIWTLFDHTTGEEIVRTRSVPFLVWKFKDIGRFTVKVDVYDNRGTVYTNQIDKMVNVMSKDQYISITEKRLNRRKTQLLN